MVKRIRPSSNGKNGADGVGYGSPPKHSRFKPGQSGNPKGRPKGVKNLKTDVLEKLNATVKVNQDGHVTKITTRRASLEVLAAKALRGDQRAIEQIIRLAEKFDPPIPRVEDSLRHDDQAIIDAYMRRRPGGQD